jgi:acyl dehydratase
MTEGKQLFFEDFPQGARLEFGHYPVTKEEVISFARAYDPQPFHLDEDAAARSMLGGLAASGWHTCAIAMRLVCDGFLNITDGRGAPGIDEVKWLKPVRPRAIPLQDKRPDRHHRHGAE